MSVRRILFCDDDPDIREIIEISLGLESQFEVKGCESASELLATIVPWHPDLILLDVMMPGMDGPTALTMMRDNPCTQSIPIVFMTACTQTYECQHFLALGATGVITKPFDPMTLASLLTGFFRVTAPRREGQESFRRRLKAEAETLLRCLWELDHSDDKASALTAALHTAQRLVATAGVCGFCASCEVSKIVDTARALDRAATNALSGRAGAAPVGDRLDGLLAHIEQQPSASRP
jgi:CheY-like chemotaxis protein